jgi:hypothetical protein
MCRTGLVEKDYFHVTAKTSAVPVVIVCGDFGSHRIVSLARRAHDLVKQKYPRTEFYLLSPVIGDEADPVYLEEEQSFRVITPMSHNDLRSLYEQADTLVLLSSGGLNRDWLVRAFAAGYPVVSNGPLLGKDDSRIIAVPRDSYSGLAEAVIRLVDDADHYRSFSVRE